MIMGSRTKDNVEVGSKAPDFALPSQSGELVSFRDFLGEKPIVLFFYPKDDWACPVSTDCLPLSYSTSSHSIFLVL
jgi:cytochrome oxidase Cu insertion factor (SCO1/SenC/PrrC family)